MLSRRVIAATYDTTAARYGETFLKELEQKPFDREQLDAFAAKVEGDGPVWDIGCGPGHVGAYLSERDARVYGLDVSRGMVAEAQRRFPAQGFVVGDMCDLPIGAGAVAGLVAFYSIIHLPRRAVADALIGMARTLRPGAPLLIAFHAGDGEIRHDEFLGEAVPIAATLFDPDEMHELLVDAGLVDVDVVVRDPYAFEYQTPRGYAWASA